MPKLTIYFDDSDGFTGIPDDLFAVGHSYMRLEGDGLNQPPFDKFYDSETNSVTIGFYPEGLNNDTGRLEKPGVDYIIESFELTDAEFESAKDELQKWIENTPEYVLDTHNCIHFADSILTSAKNFDIVSGGSQISEARLEELGGAAARYAANHFGDGNYYKLSFLTNLQKLPVDFKSDAGKLVDKVKELFGIKGNEHLMENSYYDPQTGDTKMLVKSGVETITFPDLDNEAGLTTYIIIAGDDKDNVLVGDGRNLAFFAEDGNDIIKPGLSRSIIDGGNGTNTVSYADIATDDSVNVDLGAGNTYLNLPDGAVPEGPPKDIFADIQNVIATKNNDVILGDEKSNVINPKGGNNSVDGGGDIDTLIEEAPADRDVHVDLMRGFSATEAKSDDAASILFNMGRPRESTGDVHNQLANIENVEINGGFSNTAYGTPGHNEFAMNSDGVNFTDGRGGPEIYTFELNPEKETIEGFMGARPKAFDIIVNFNEYSKIDLIPDVSVPGVDGIFGHLYVEVWNGEKR